LPPPGLTVAPEQADRDHLTDESGPARPVDRSRTPRPVRAAPVRERAPRDRSPRDRSSRDRARTVSDLDFVPRDRARATADRDRATRRGSTAPRAVASTASRADASTASRADATRPVRPAPAQAGVPGRRTVTIQGRGSDRSWTPTGERKRPTRRPHEREGFRPDRAAMWAVMLGIFLVLVAATSSHAAVRAHVARSAASRAAAATHVAHRSAATAAAHRR
jgi:hypothetical protein